MDETKPRDEPPRDPKAGSLGQIIDELCDEFEADWKRGESPRIEDFLDRVARQRRGELLAHLLATELYWRRRNSEAPTPEEYGQRFPDDREVVDRQFQAEETRRSIATSESAADSASAVDTEVRPTSVEPRPPASTPPASTPPNEPRPFGNYRLLEELGRGGMGVVYRAWQPSANRYVALKLIRRDRFESLPRDSQVSVIHRFEHEAQASGRIDHDHIVTVYEVGEIDGEHFFSMCYVEGRSLDDVLTEGVLDGRKAAAWLEPVARAVHEAHLHGILHRDLKPQNILIDAKTDRALVADFGLAKLAESAEEMTEVGTVMGTPPYMSPEQAKDSTRVTAKSDVYSLGATLYRAVAGRPPFQAASALETIRLVVDEPPLPLRQIDSRIDRDLETICQKCLEKDPAQRYASAEVLADELRRYLNHEPIEARPLGMVGRSVRWCRRYPVVALLLGCTIVFILVALTASIVGYVQTSRALAVSERNYRRHRDTVDQSITRVSEESLLNQPGMQPLRQELLELALRSYEQFVEERGDDPAVRDELAVTAYRLGRITEQLGSVDKAEHWYRQALAVQEELVSERPQDSHLQQGLSDTLNAMGEIFLAKRKLDAALVFYQRAATQREQLANADPDNTEMQRKLANSYMNLGVVARESGTAEEEARKRFVQAQTLRYKVLERDADNLETQRDLAMGCYNLANLYTSIETQDAASASSNFEKALGQFEEALERFETLLVSQPNDLANQYRAALTARLYADLLCHLGHSEQARQPYHRALGLMRHLARLNPDVPGYRLELAGILMNLGLIQREQTPDNRTEAANSFAEARGILEELVDEHPEDPQYARDLAATLCATGNLVSHMGDQQSALELIRRARRYFETLCLEYPEHDEYAQLLEDVKQREQAVVAIGQPDEPSDRVVEDAP